MMDYNPEDLPFLSVINEYIKQKEFNKALERLDTYLKEISPNHRIERILVYNKKCEILCNQQEFELAENSAKLALEISELQPVISLGKAAALTYLGIIARVRGKYPDAISSLKDAEYIIETLNKPRRHITILNNLGIIYRRTGKHQLAENSVVKIIDLIEKNKIQDPVELGRAYTTLGSINLDIGKLTDSEKYYLQSLKIYDESKILAGVASSKNNLGIIYKRRGDYNHAEKYFQDSSKLYEDLKLYKDMGHPINNLAGIYRLKGDLKKSETYFKRALALFRKVGNQYFIVSTFNSLGTLHFARGNYKTAQANFEKAYSKAKELNHSNLIIATLNNLGNILFQRGYFIEAEKHYQKALELYKALSNEHGIAQMLINLATVYKTYGDQNKAERCLLDSLLFFKKLNNPKYIFEIRSHLLAIYLNQNNVERADLELSEMKKIRNIGNLPENQILYHLALGRYNLFRHNYSSAEINCQYANSKALKLSLFNLQILSMQLLIQDYLQLFRLTNKLEFKEKLETILIKMQQICEREGLHSFIIENIFFQGLFKKIEGNFPLALEKFKKANELSNNLGVTPLIQKINQEIKNLKKQVLNSRAILKIAPQAYKHTQIQDMINYLGEVEKIVI